MTSKRDKSGRKHRNSTRDEEIKVHGSQTVSPAKQYEEEPSVSDSSSSGSSSDSLDSDDDTQDGDAHSSNVGSRLQMMIDPMITMHQ